MKILIVDDNETNLYLLQALLTGNKHEVVSAANGAEAMVCLQQSSVDLIISDILMPVMDGFTFCRKVKSNPDLARIPFIIYTATYTRTEDKKLALELGADEFVLKPVEADEMLRIIDQVMSKERRALNPGNEDTEKNIMTLYNEALVRKLEHKVFELEEVSQARLNAMERNKRMEELLDATQAVSKIGGWEWNMRTREMYWTRETCNIHDLVQADDFWIGDNLIGTSLACYPEEDRARIQAAFERCVNEGLPYEMECQFISLKGRKLWIKTSGQAFSENGVITKVRGNIQDITEQKNAMLEQEKLREQLLRAQKLDSIGRLTGGIAHDFNNILTVILGYSEQLMVSSSLSETDQKDISEIKKAGERALKLTRQLLAFSKRQVQKPEVLNLCQIVQDVSNMLRRLIGSDVLIEFKPNPELARIKADAGQIEQVILNLVINAKEAMPQGGTITIECRNQDVEPGYSQEHYNLQPGSYVMLCVSDTGIGMDHETQNRIFEPFFTTKADSKGTGLGLPTVYGIVTQSGGNIFVYSEPGKGSTFKILLPATTESEVKPSEKIPEPEPGNGELLFIVEDDDAIAGLIKRITSSLNYRCRLFSTAKAALQAMSELLDKPDMMLIDMVLPGMSGIDLFQRIKRSFPEVPVLLMSGYSDQVALSEIKTAQEVHFLQKPFTDRDLASNIRHLLSLKRSRQKVLIIDDDESIRMLLQRQFSKRGYGFFGVDDLKDAENVLNNQSIDIIIVDMNLGGDDGISVIRQLREKGFSQAVILLSGSVSHLDEDSVKDLNIFAFVEKTVGYQELFWEIEKIH